MAKDWSLISSSMFFYLILFFLSICIHTHVEVALHPALLLHGMNGNKLSAQTPAHTPISELIPVRPGASQKQTGCLSRFPEGSEGQRRILGTRLPSRNL
uniref:Uncharacterized protein n=1 Tax=Poecilia mexicana TaxID=48701 RepID=A0A3B3XQK0_9TELE